MADNKVYIVLDVKDQQAISAVKGFDKQTEQAFDKMRTNAEKASTGMGGSLQKLKQHWLAVAAAMTGVILALKKCVTAASDLQEVTSKFNVVFADQIELAESWSAALVEGYAMSTRESKQYLSSIQDLLVPMGMQRDLAGQLSFEITKLAADLGSFNNLPTAQVMADVQSALVGNYETMKKYGVVINATMVQEQALAMGLARTKGELTTAQKAYAAYTMIVRDSEAAVGDTARTQGEYANTLKRYKAATEDLAASIGTSLLPALRDTFDWLTKIVKKYNEWVKGPDVIDTLLRQRVALEDQIEVLRERMAHDSAFADMLKMQGVSVNELTEQYKAQIEVLQKRIALIDKSINEENRLRAEQAKGGAGGGGGGGGGGGFDEELLKRYKEAMKGSAREIGAEWALVNQVTAAHRGEIMLMEQAYREALDTGLLERYKEVTKATTSEAGAEWRLINEVTAAHRGEIMLMEQAYESLGKKGTSTFDDLKNAVTGWASTFSAQLTDMLWAADMTFAKILESFGRMITQMVIQKAVVEPLLGSLFPAKAAAHGAAFDQGRLLPFGRGGIVDRPTIFPMAGGMGLMGEKGPEGVLPLARTRSGDLGVKADTSKAEAPNVQINMINQSGRELEAIQKGGRNESGKWVIDVVMRELRTGRGLRNMIRSTT